MLELCLTYVVVIAVVAQGFPLSPSLLPRGMSTRPPLFLHSSALTSALESVSENNERARELLKWIVPSEELVDSQTPGSDEELLPLYPLSATYLPVGNHTLRNTEPRNLRMAQDLGTDCRFCVVLSAVDTGRIATVGTVFRILEMVPHRDAATDQLVRIVLTCQAEEIVDIVGIRNPQAVSWENRLRRSSEYLVARVRPRKSTNNDVTNGEASARHHDIERKVSEIVENYHAVRDMYLKAVGVNDLPPFSKEKLAESLPKIARSSLINDIWKVAQDWQTICYTFREGRQIALASDRNELMVSAAIRNGGALKLPVHLEDLEPKDRQEIQSLEVEAHQSWLQLDLDPCIDFQVLLDQQDHQDRLDHLGGMIHREKLRLGALRDNNSLTNQDTSSDNCVGTESEILPQIPRKGAWFDDGYW
jgi:hypothetical protein